jgi:predicted negative regulator of RcsB-dependent stress response
MLPSEEISRIKSEIEKLEFALKDCTDSNIREVIEIRLDERRLRLRQLNQGGRSA